MFRVQVEATEVFFAVTKLFQSSDSNLRRMVYLIIKEICPSADEVRKHMLCHLDVSNLQRWIDLSSFALGYNCDILADERYEQPHRFVSS